MMEQDEDMQVSFFMCENDNLCQSASYLTGNYELFLEF